MSNIQGCGPRQRGWSWSLRGRWELCPPGFVSPGVTPVAGLTVSARGGQGPTSSQSPPYTLPGSPHLISQCPPHTHPRAPTSSLCDPPHILPRTPHLVSL